MKKLFRRRDLKRDNEPLSSVHTTAVQRRSDGSIYSRAEDELKHPALPEGLPLGSDS